MLVSIFNPPITEFRSFSMQKEFCLVIEVSIIDDPEDRYSRTMTSLKNAIIPSFLTGNFDKRNSFFFMCPAWPNRIRRFDIDSVSFVVHKM